MVDNKICSEMITRVIQPLLVPLKDELDQFKHLKNSELESGAKPPSLSNYQVNEICDFLELMGGFIKSCVPLS
jgi:hypothetical protein